jgi:plastocyanin
VSSLKAVVVCAAVGFMTVQCGGRKGGAAAGGISPVASSQPATKEVRIEQYKFIPETIHVAVGGVIKWTNFDDVGHTVSFTSADTARRQIRSRQELFDPSRPSHLYGSKLFGRNETFSAKFERAGRFAYICDPHPYMKGTVVVE